MDNNNTGATPTDAAEAPRESATIVELAARIDERDEIIRLLNEALSRALTDLGLAQAA